METSVISYLTIVVIAVVLGSFFIIVLFTVISYWVDKDYDIKLKYRNKKIKDPHIARIKEIFAQD